MHVSQPLIRWTSATALAVGAVCLPALASQAAEPAPGNKAQIEHTEAQVSPLPANKAQIEHAERVAAAHAAVPAQAAAPGVVGEGGGTVGWQLALSALGGAALAGGVIVTAQHVSRHHHHSSAVA